MKIFYNFLMLSLSICFAVSCDKNIIVDEKEDAETVTKASASTRRFHWTCKCGAWNGGWHSRCPKCYNKYMNSIHVTNAYAEAFDYAWYKVTHILYPGVQKPSVVKLEYDKWTLSASRNLKGDKGSGLKDGSKAAVDAFVNR